MSPKKISIIIPVFNNLHYTINCLSSLKKQKIQEQMPGFVAETIVVDDGSSDGTSNWIKQNHPDVHIVNGNGNLWWSGAINKGVQYAINALNSDYTLWWNNDIVAADDYFTELQKIINVYETPDLIIGSMVSYTARNKTWSLGGRFDPKSGKKFLYGVHNLSSADNLNPIEVDWLAGMGTVIHASVYERIGYCDDLLFPQYHGDSDFSFRAKRYGLKVMAFPSLVIYNDNTNTGLIHQGSFKRLLESLVSIKSNFNIKKDFAFYKKHSTSIIAYKELIKKYINYIGGFFKWKILNLFGIKKKYP